MIQPIIGVLASTPSTSSFSIHPHIPIMVERYAPLILVAPLHNILQHYQTRIPQFDGTGRMNAQQHVDKNE